MNAKYVNAVPLYRQEQEFLRCGLHISIPLSLFLFRFPAGNGLRLFNGFFCANGFWFIKEYDLPIHLHKGDLVLGYREAEGWL